MVSRNIGALSDRELEKLAREELNEDPSRRDADIKAIKDWLKKQPHLDGNVCIGMNGSISVVVVMSTLVVAVATVAQSVKRPELRSL